MRYLTQEYSRPHILYSLFFKIRVLMFLATCSHLNSIPTHGYYVICCQNSRSTLQDYLGAANKTNHLRYHCPLCLSVSPHYFLPHHIASNGVGDFNIEQEYGRYRSSHNDINRQMNIVTASTMRSATSGSGSQ